MAIIVWGPAQLVEKGNASNDAYVKALTDTRGSLVQAVGGLAVLLGVIVGLLGLLHSRQLLSASRQEHMESLEESRKALQETLEFNRESLLKTVAVTERGQITDRFSKAIEQLGRSADDAMDLRLGGIYALEQIAKDSPDWHQPVVEVLAAFVRQHAFGLDPPAGNTIDDQIDALLMLDGQVAWPPLPVDIGAAMEVLSRRNRSNDGNRKLGLDRVDFRRADIPVSLNLARTSFQNARLQFSSCMFVDFRECFFLETDLRGAVLVQTDLRGADFSSAQVEGADFAEAQLKGATFEGVDLSHVRNLSIEQLKLAKVDEYTILPAGIDRAALGSAVAPQGPI